MLGLSTSNLVPVALLFVGTVAALALVVSGVISWRLAILALLAYIPFAGLPRYLLYPAEWPVLVPDFILLLPAYIGFGIAFRRREVGLPPYRAITALIVLFAIIAVAQSFNPGVPRWSVAVIGLRDWIYFIPLYVLGYNLVRNIGEARRLVTVVCCAGLIPAVIGIAEAFLFVNGHQRVVYAIYGAAADAATQHFFAFPIGAGLVLRRVPSTFTFVSLYYFFATAMVAFSFALWKLAPIRLRGAALALHLVFIVAALSSGQRAAFVFIPLLVWLMTVLGGSRRQALVLTAGLLAGATLAILAFVSRSTLNPVVVSLQTGIRLFRETFVDGVRLIAGTTWIGLGTGTATEATRFVVGHPTQFNSIPGGPAESWYLRAWIELGVEAPLILLTILLSMIGTAWRNQYTKVSARLRPLSAALIALIVWNAIYGIKGSPIALEPMNVYFWLSAGILAALPSLSEGASSGSSTTTATSDRYRVPST
jgi:hypothetical protein